MNNLTGKITESALIKFGLDNFANETYIDKMISMDKFCSHGSYFSDCHELFEDFEDDYPDVLDNKETMKRFLTYWIPHRIRYLAKDIISELSHFKELYRASYLTEDHTRNIKENMDSVPIKNTGIYWSSRKDTYSFTPKTVSENDFDVLLSTDIVSEKIDWYETIVSRIDYINGDQEQEFCLLPNESININKVKARKVSPNEVTKAITIHS